MAVRVLHLADLHLGVDNYGRFDPQRGYNSRVADFLRALDMAVERAADVDLVLIAGDVYKTPTPSPTLQREFAARVRRLSRLAPVVIIPGNHDVPNAAERATSIDIFGALELDGVIVERLRGVHTVTTRSGPVQVAAHAWVAESRLKTQEEFKGLTIEESRAKMEEILCGSIESLAEGIDPNVPAILMTHYAVRGCDVGGYPGRSLFMPEVQLPLGSLALHPFDYVALGHIHKHQVMNPGAHPPIVYPGSIERIDFGEEREPKGFVIAEVARGSTTWEFVEVPARRFVTVRVDADAEDPTEKVVAAIGREEIREAVVRVLYTLPDGRPALREPEIRQALKEAFLVATVRRERDARSARERNVRLNRVLPPLEALQEYLKTQPDLQQREAELIEYARPLIDTISAKG
jgi:DNA repair protein SbcD/Mre11